MWIDLVYYHLKILRPLNVFTSGLAMIVSASILNQIESYYVVSITCIVVMCYTGASNALNDAIDLKSDLINRPYRPIPSGKISRSAAVALSFVLFTAGSIICLQLADAAKVIGIIISVPMLIFYNIYFKGVYLLGNFAVGLVIGMSFIFSGAAHYSIAPMWIPAFLAFGLTFLREIIKDLEDIRGDKISGLLTYPISSDLKQTTRLIILIAASVGLAALIPYLIGYYGTWYLIALVIGVEIPLVLVVFLFIKNPVVSTAKICSKILKLSTLMGLVAIYMGKL